MKKYMHCFSNNLDKMMGVRSISREELFCNLIGTVIIMIFYAIYIHKLTDRNTLKIFGSWVFILLLVNVSSEIWMKTYAKKECIELSQLQIKINEILKIIQLLTIPSITINQLLLGKGFILKSLSALSVLLIYLLPTTKKKLTPKGAASCTIAASILINFFVCMGTTFFGTLACLSLYYLWNIREDKNKRYKLLIMRFFVAFFVYKTLIQVATPTSPILLKKENYTNDEKHRAFGKYYI